MQVGVRGATDDHDHAQMDAGEDVAEGAQRGHRRRGPSPRSTSMTDMPAHAHQTQAHKLKQRHRRPSSSSPKPKSKSASASASASNSRSPRLRPRHHRHPRPNVSPLSSRCSSRCSSRHSSRSPSSSRPRYFVTSTSSSSSPSRPLAAIAPISILPNEVMLHILGFLDVNDLLAMSRTSHHFRSLCVAPILRIQRLRYTRAALPPLLAAPQRPSLTELIQRSIFLTNTTVVSRKLARSLVTIRLAHRLAARPPVHVLVERCVLPPECAPGIGHVAPALAARTRAIEREKLKDGLRNWVGAVWRREVGRRSEHIRRSDESVGVGKVWRLRKFWERISRGGGGGGGEVAGS